MQLRSEIALSASPAAVRAVVWDTARYPEWNPLIVALSGGLTPGANLRVSLALPELGEWRLGARVVAASEEELRVATGYLLPALLRGEYFLRVTATESGSRVVQGVDVAGFLSSRLSRRLTGLARGMALLNQALERRVARLTKAGAL